MAAQGLVNVGTRPVIVGAPAYFLRYETDHSSWSNNSLPAEGYRKSLLVEDTVILE